MTDEAALAALLRADQVRWRLLGIVRGLRLPDDWVGAGFVRSAVWDRLHDRAATPPDGDVDVVWFDRSHPEAEQDRRLEAQLRIRDPGTDWSVKNQARMHHRNGDAPYASVSAALERWPETATAVAVRRTEDDRLEVCAPFGLQDLFNLVLRPTPAFAGARRGVFEARMAAKDWQRRWPQLRCVSSPPLHAPGTTPPP